MPEKKQHHREDDEKLHAMGDAKTDHLLVYLRCSDQRATERATLVHLPTFAKLGRAEQPFY